MGAQGKEVRALAIRLSRARPGPFTTDHMLPWHPNTSLTTRQPFPTLILFGQTAPNTPPFCNQPRRRGRALAEPRCLAMMRRGKGCELSNSSHSCHSHSNTQSFTLEIRKNNSTGSGSSPGTAAQGAGGVPSSGGISKLCGCGTWWLWQCWGCLDSMV